jgi:hypothetical protein
MMTMRRTLKTEYPLGFKKASAQSAALNDFEILTRLDELSAWSGLKRDDDAVPAALSKKASQSAESTYATSRRTPTNYILHHPSMKQFTT